MISVPQGDTINVIRYVAHNYVGRALAWDFVRANWDKLYNDYGGSSFSFSNLIESITAQFNTPFDLEELTDFGEGREFGSATRAYQQSLEKCQSNIKWMNRNAENIELWLQGNAVAVI